MQSQSGQPSEGTEVSSSLTKENPTSPSESAQKAAKQLLATPIAMGELSESLKAVMLQLEEVQKQLDSVVERVVETLVRPAVEDAVSSVVPSLYFLNEAHETHVTKQQARKEREARKAKGKSKKRTVPTRRNKPTPRRGR